MEDRLQKILARAGFGSRRKCEELISLGRVLVNGNKVVLGSKADSEKDLIMVDGKPINKAEEIIYIMIYKPRNVLSTVSSPDSRQSVRDLIPLSGTLFPVGRLDVDSEGLLLLTNDGELANKLTHPRYGHEKEYLVLVAHHPDASQLATWRRGVVLEDGFHTRAADVRVVKNSGKGTWLNITMTEGHKRQIRETGKIIGLPVVKIIRIRMGTLRLGSLKAGQWRYLNSEEVKSIIAPQVK